MASDELWGRPVRRLLVVAREHIGDLVNTTAYLAALQNRFPNAELTVDVGRPAAPVLENFPGIARVWIREKHEGLGGKLKRLIRVRAGRFELAVIFDDSSRFVLECYLGGIPLRVGILRKRFGRLFTQKVAYSRDFHDVFDPFGQLVELIGAPVSDPRPRLYPSPADFEAVQGALKEIGQVGKGLVGLNPSTVRPYNRWLPENWSGLADRFESAGYRPVLLGPPGDIETHRDIARGCRVEPLDWTGKWTVLQLSEAVRQLQLLVSVDTGTAHLAGAVGTPVAVLYGVTEPHRFRPYGNRFVAVRTAEKTLPSIDPESAFRAAQSLLEG